MIHIPFSKWETEKNTYNFIKYYFKKNKPVWLYQNKVNNKYYEMLTDEFGGCGLLEGGYVLSEIATNEELCY